MAHELDRKADGTAAMFSVRQTPWHREGTLLRDAPSLDEALRLGGLDFEVEVRPLYTRIRQYPGTSNIFGYHPAAGLFYSRRELHEQERKRLNHAVFCPFRNRVV